METTRRIFENKPCILFWETSSSSLPATTERCVKVYHPHCFQTKKIKIILLEHVDKETGERVLSQNSSGGVRHASWDSYPISDQNRSVIFPTQFQTAITSKKLSLQKKKKKKKNIPNSRLQTTRGCTKHYPISDPHGYIPNFIPKGVKPIPFCAEHTYMLHTAYIRECPHSPAKM